MAHKSIIFYHRLKMEEKQVYTKDLKSIVEDFNNYFTSVGKITAATALDLANKNNIALSGPMLNAEIYPTDQQFRFKPVTCSVIRRIIIMAFRSLLELIQVLTQIVNHPYLVSYRVITK